MSARGIKAKWVMLLVAMAFGWISVGSLIMFHKEHVLRQHVDLPSYLFVAPKSKQDASSGFRIANVRATAFQAFGFTAVSPSFDQIFYGLDGPVTFIHGDSCPTGSSVLFSLQALRAPPQA